MIMPTTFLFLSSLLCCIVQISSAYVKPWILSDFNNPLLGFQKRPKRQNSNPIVAWNATIPFHESSAQEMLSAGSVDYMSSDSFRIPMVFSGDEHKEEEGDCSGPRFCVNFYPKVESSEDASSSCARFSLQHLPESTEEESRRYYDTTFCLRLNRSSELLEWKGSKRFGAFSKERILSKDEFYCGAFPSEKNSGLLFDACPSAVSATTTALEEMDVVNHDKIRWINLEAEIVIHGSGLVKGKGRRKVTSDISRIDRQKSGWKFWQEYGKEKYYDDDEEENWIQTGMKAVQFQDVRASLENISSSAEKETSNPDNALGVGSVIIPLLSTRVEGILPEVIERPLRILLSTLFSATVLGGSWVNVPKVMNPHRSMWEKGVYPGIDYRITRIVDRETSSEDSIEEEEQDLFYHRSGVDYDLEPIYPLGSMLERKWPVTINEAQIPSIISPLQYNIATAIGALAASASILGGFFLLSLMISLFFIPSRSMEPTLNVGDVLLVEKISPRVPFLNRYHPGDVVMFRPPSALRDLVEANGGRLSNRDLFVKRIAAVQGEVVEVRKNGEVKVISGVENRQTPDRNLCGGEPLGLIKKYIKPGVMVVPPGKVLLLGDCSSVSVDGRVWGTLDTNEIMGRPMLRTWPASKMSKIPDLPTMENQWEN